MLVYCPVKYKSQRMCGKAVDDCLAALKFFPNWLIVSKMLEKSDNAVHANDDILFYNEEFDNVTSLSCQRHSCCRS